MALSAQEKLDRLMMAKLGLAPEISKTKLKNFAPVVEDMRFSESEDDEISIADMSDVSSVQNYVDISDSESDDSVAENSFDSSRPKTPQVVVFSDTSTSKNVGLVFNKREKRAFMSSKLTEQLETKKPVSTKEIAEDEEDIKNNRELMDILKMSKLVEQFTADDLTGKARRNYIQQKITELGGKPAKPQKASLSMAIGLQRVAKERNQKRIQEAKDLGMYHSSLKHHYEDIDKRNEKETSRKAFRRSQKDRVDIVDGGGIGKFKNGVLRISKKDIAGMTPKKHGGASKRLLGKLNDAGKQLGKNKGVKIKHGKKWH
ncbi:hypothetical protein HK096_010301 [Nowakowskiella sp. JEL0078]|nr:hypothetical protein HK096_010301 [Nowakowskiella sp. JEL0078]